MTRDEAIEIIRRIHFSDAPIPSGSWIPLTVDTFVALGMLKLEADSATDDAKEAVRSYFGSVGVGEVVDASGVLQAIDRAGLEIVPKDRFSNKINFNGGYRR